MHYDDWGSDKTYPHMAVPWSWAFDTPFKWTKQVASHFGGTRQGMAISWPGHIKDVGGIRTQFHHIIDIVPTILEAAGIQAPDMVNGIKQRPIEGVSMVYTFDKANANAPSKRDTQYFEMVGNRAIYHDGWIACDDAAVAAWLMGTGKMPVDQRVQVGALQHRAGLLGEQRSGGKNPDKLKEMQALFLSRRRRSTRSIPLDNSGFVRIADVATERDSRQDGLHLHRREARHPGRQRAQHSQPGLHHHRRTSPSLMAVRRA